MGRFYKTAKPDFVDDFIYQPPWELMAKSAERKQIQYDNALAQTSALNDLLKIKHRDEEVENQNVADFKIEVEEGIDALTNQLREDGDYRKIMPKVREMQKKLVQSREDGEIAKWENTYNIYQQHLDAVKKAKEKGGDVAGALKALEHFDKRWRDQENRSLDGVMGYEELIARPDALDYDKTLEQVLKLKPDLAKYIDKRPDGKGYIINNEGKEKGLTEQDIMNLVMNKVGQDPNVAAYYEQRDRFGLSPDVYDRDNNKLNILKGYEDIKDSKGKVIGQKPIFHENELASYIRGFNPAAYREKESILEYSPDSTWSGIQNRANQRYLQNQRLQADKDKEGRKAEAKLKAKILAGDATEDEKYEYNRLQGIYSWNTITPDQGKTIFDLDPNDPIQNQQLQTILNSVDPNGHNPFINTITNGILNGKYSNTRDLDDLISSNQFKNDFISTLKYSDEGKKEYIDYLKSVNRGKSFTDKDYEDITNYFISNNGSYKGLENLGIDRGLEGFKFGWSKGDIVSSSGNFINSVKNYTEDLLGVQSQNKLKQYYLDKEYQVQFEPLNLNSEQRGNLATQIFNNSNMYSYVRVTPNGNEEIPVEDIDTSNYSHEGISAVIPGKALSGNRLVDKEGNEIIAIPIKEENNPVQSYINKIAKNPKTGLKDNSITLKYLQSPVESKFLKDLSELETTTDLNDGTESGFLEDTYYNTGGDIRVGNYKGKKYYLYQPPEGWGPERQFDTKEEMLREIAIQREAMNMKSNKK